MIKIRLVRGGSTHDAHFRIVVADQLKSKYILDIVGHYHPTQKENRIVINKEKFEHFVKNGAQPTQTVAKLAVLSGIADAAKFVKPFTPRKKGEFQKKKKK